MDWRSFPGPHGDFKFNLNRGQALIKESFKPELEIFTMVLFGQQLLRRGYWVVTIVIIAALCFSTSKACSNSDLPEILENSRSRVQAGKVQGFTKIPDGEFSLEFSFEKTLSNLPLFEATNLWLIGNSKTEQGAVFVDLKKLQVLQTTSYQLTASIVVSSGETVTVTDYLPPSAGVYRCRFSLSNKVLGIYALDEFGNVVEEYTKVLQSAQKFLPGSELVTWYGSAPGQTSSGGRLISFAITGAKLFAETCSPTVSPTPATAKPTSSPSTESPTAKPTSSPTENPSAKPTSSPTETPTASPTNTEVDPIPSPIPSPTVSPNSTGDSSPEITVVPDNNVLYTAAIAGGVSALMTSFAFIAMFYRRSRTSSVHGSSKAKQANDRTSSESIVPPRSWAISQRPWSQTGPSSNFKLSVSTISSEHSTNKSHGSGGFASDRGSQYSGSGFTLVEDVEDFSVVLDQTENELSSEP